MNTFSPLDYLKHILDETHFITETTSGISLENLHESALLQRALCRSLEVIGEATKNLNHSFRNKYPQIDWRAIAGTRDKIIHHYFDVDLDMVYEICTLEIPELEFDIKAILLLEESNENNPG